MTVDRYLRLIAGFFIIFSLVLSRVHSEYWLYFTASGSTSSILFTNCAR
jgi:hypothetical protein